MKVIYSVCSLMLMATLASAVERINMNCRDCYRADDDGITKKCCEKWGQFQTGPTTCSVYPDAHPHGMFMRCCSDNKCQTEA